MKDKNNENQYFHYIYFIETHKDKEKYKLRFSEGFNDKEIPKLELVNKKTCKIDNGLTFLSRVFRFKMDNFNDNFSITLTLEDPNKTKYELNINKNKMPPGKYFHIFLYDYEFTTKKLFKTKSPSELCKLSHEYQFNLYLEGIKDKFKDLEQNKIIEDLLVLTQLFFKGKAEYDFLFFMSVFIESYKRNSIKVLLLFFKFEGITELGEQNEEKINRIKDVINYLTANPEIIFNYIKKYDENDKKNLVNILHNIIFYFNYNFQKEKINIMLEDDKINKNLFNLILHYSQKFTELILPKKIISKFIKISNNFQEIKDIFKYNNDCYDILFVININKEIILSKYNTEEKIPPISIDQYVQPKEKDNLIEIVALITEIFLFQIENGSKFIIFPPIFFKKYLDLADGMNYDNLISLKNIMNKYIIKNIYFYLNLINFFYKIIYRHHQ